MPGTKRGPEEPENNKRTKLSSDDQLLLVPQEMSISDICQALEERGIDARSLLVKRLEEAIRIENEVSNNNDIGLLKEIELFYDWYNGKDYENMQQEPSSSVLENRHIQTKLVAQGREDIANAPIKVEEETQDNEYIETETGNVKVKVESQINYLSLIHI